MDFPYPGFLPPAFGQNGPWWFSFYQTHDIPEALIQGKEREYISMFMRGLAYNPAAITEKIKQVQDKWKNKFPNLAFKFENLRYDSLLNFNLSFTNELQFLNMENK